MDVVRVPTSGTCQDKNPRIGISCQPWYHGWTFCARRVRSFRATEMVWPLLGILGPVQGSRHTR